MESEDSGQSLQRILPVIRQNWIFILFGIIGLVLVGYGVWMAVKPDEAKVEIVTSGEVRGESRDEKEIFIDVSGAVEKPSVYKLPNNSRIGDALVMAGGLSAEADREYVSKTINLAQQLKDGQKIYVPVKSANSDNQKTQKVGEPEKSDTQKNSLININTASVSELDSLWGIGEARAQAIIANRPYSDTSEIVSKAKVPQSTYDKIKDQISVY